MLKESGSEVNKIECCFILHPKWYDVLCFFVLGWVGMECKKIGSIFKTRKRHHPLALANFRSGFSIGESHTVGWNPAPPGEYSGFQVGEMLWSAKMISPEAQREFCSAPIRGSPTYIGPHWYRFISLRDAKQSKGDAWYDPLICSETLIWTNQINCQFTLWATLT